MARLIVWWVAEYVAGSVIGSGPSVWFGLESGLWPGLWLGCSLFCDMMASSRLRLWLGLRLELWLVSGGLCSLETQLQSLSPPLDRGSCLVAQKLDSFLALQGPGSRCWETQQRGPSGAPSVYLELAQHTSSSVVHTTVWEIVRTCFYSNQPPTSTGFL